MSVVSYINCKAGKRLSIIISSDNKSVTFYITILNARALLIHLSKLKKNLLFPAALNTLGSSSIVEIFGINRVEQGIALLFSSYGLANSSAPLIAGNFRFNIIFHF